MSSVPENVKYTKEHEWISESGSNRFKVGITDYAQSALGDIVYIQLPKMGQTLQQGSVCGEVESTKSVSEIYAPLSGTVVTLNTALDAAPETMNKDPYGEGWIFEVEITDQAQLSSLLDPSAYQALIS
jgi:glycine cleavage system H protein